ncbi:MAG: UDP-N-acetylmuramate dehydrogenase [Bacteroidales bacterium]|nr:UDP-N-acetylmuramate dehydrogenase [Bacteroidales bacterium]
MLIYSDFSLKESNTFNIEAKAANYIEIAGLDDIENFVRKRKYFEMPRLILGNGSNILFTKDFKGVVLKNIMKGIKVQKEDDQTVTLKVSSGENLDTFIEYSLKNRWSGLENLSAIPGTVGGAAFQNAGAYGAEMKNYVVEIEYYDFEDFTLKSIKAEDCKFGYRTSVFKTDFLDKVFITAVTLRLNKKFTAITSYANLEEKLKEFTVLTPSIMRRVITAMRNEKLPDYKKLGNAGSFFKNPEITKQAFEKLSSEFEGLKNYPSEDGKIKLSAGQLIDLCGFKTTEAGSKVGVAQNNALIVINLGDANGKDVLVYAKKIEKAVKDKFGIKLEPEVVIC